MNFQALGLEMWAVLVSHLTIKDIEGVENHPTTYLAEELLGEYRYLCIHVTNDIDSVIAELYKDSIIRLVPILGQYSDEFNGYKIKDFEKEIYYRLPERYSQEPLERYDYKTLLAISKKPDESFLSISKRTGMSRAVISERYSKLLKEGVILKNRFACDIYSMEFEAYIMMISIKPKDKKSLLQALLRNHFTGHIYSSPNLIIFNYICPQNTDLQKMISQLKDNYDIQISVYQNSGTYYINTMPEYVKRYIEEKIKT